MKRKIERKKTIQSGPRVAHEIAFNDRTINYLYVKDGPRIDFRFKNIKVPYLTGLKLRYSPLTQKKRYYSKYRFKGKTKWLKLGEHLEGKYGILEVSQELLNLYSKYYDKVKGYWLHDPAEQLITERDLKKSEQYSIREVIKRLVQAGFPRKAKLGRLSKVSARTHSRYLLGYNERFEQLIFDEDEKGQVIIKLKPGLTWETLWSKYPPTNVDPKRNNDEVSIFDTNTLGPTIIDLLGRGSVKNYLNVKERSPGTKENILDAIQCLWNYAAHKLECFGDKLPTNPTLNIEILRSDESKYKGSKWNEVSYEDWQQKELDRAYIKLVRKKPFDSECFMLLSAASNRIRIEEILKLKKSDIREDHILLRKEVQKERSKGKTEDIEVFRTDEINRALNRLNRQYKRKCNERFKWIPWLFPSSRIAWDRVAEPGYAQSNHTRKKSLNNAWEEVRKLISFEASMKAIRKTVITTEVEHEKAKGKTKDEAIETVSKKFHKSPRMVKQKYYKQTESMQHKGAKELSKVIQMKRKS